MMSEMKNWKNENYECYHLRFQSANICVNPSFSFSQINADFFLAENVNFPRPSVFLSANICVNYFLEFFSQIYADFFLADLR